MEQTSKDGQPSGVVVPEPLQVNEVRKQWMVRADNTVAEQIQEDDFKFKYGQNRQRRRTVRGDVREARRLGSEEERLAEQERRKQKILENAIRTQMLLQEETVKGGKAHSTEQERDDEQMARNLQKKEDRRSFEGPASQRHLAEQCQRQLQKRHSSRTSDDAETEPGEETRVTEDAASSQTHHMSEDEEAKRKSMEKEDAKLARALQKEEQRRTFEKMRHQREQIYIQQQVQMYRDSDEETAPDEAS